jgi:hypothetical protein
VDRSLGGDGGGRRQPPAHDFNGGKNGDDLFPAASVSATILPIAAGRMVSTWAVRLLPAI